jgi:hypothetical protein
MTTSNRKTKRPRHAVGAKLSAVTRPVRHIAGPTGETSEPADRDDTELGAPLERDVDSVEATQIEAIFEEPLHVDDDAIVDDADSTASRRR